MGLLDPVLVRWDDKRAYWWLQRGRETFFDEDCYQLHWPASQDAIQWAEEHLGVTPSLAEVERAQEPHANDEAQPRLF